MMNVPVFFLHLVFYYISYCIDLLNGVKWRLFGVQMHRSAFLQRREVCLRLRWHLISMPTVLSTFQPETREPAKSNKVRCLLICRVS